MIRLEADERGRLCWGISARSERWKRRRDAGVGRNVEEFQSSPFKRSLRHPFPLPSLHLHRPPSSFSLHDVKDDLKTTVVLATASTFTSGSSHPDRSSPAFVWHKERFALKRDVYKSALYSSLAVVHKCFLKKTKCGFSVRCRPNLAAGRLWSVFDFSRCIQSELFLSPRTFRLKFRTAGILQRTPPYAPQTFKIPYLQTPTEV